MKNADKILSEMKFQKIGSFYVENKNFIIDYDQKYAALEKMIYVHTLDNEILRIGSSKNKFKSRMQSWERDVSKSLKGEKSSTPIWESKIWNKILKNKIGILYGRQGTIIETPCGKINCYLTEESFMIGKFQPRMNRSKHR